jgi:hypothetical protein
MKVGIVVTGLRKLRKVHDICTWFDSRSRQEISLLCKVSRPALGLVEAPVQWVSEDISSGTKQSARESRHSHQYA